MGGEHHRYYKHNKFHQNPRGDPKFLVDLTQNDPYAVIPVKFLNRTQAGNTWLCWLLFHCFGRYKMRKSYLSGIAHVFSIAMF